MIFAVSKLVEAAMGEISAEAPAWQETINNWKSELEESKKDEEQDSIWDDEEKEDESIIITTTITRKRSRNVDYEKNSDVEKQV